MNDRILIIAFFGLLVVVMLSLSFLALLQHHLLVHVIAITIAAVSAGIFVYFLNKKDP